MRHYQPNIHDMHFVLSKVLSAPEQLKSLQAFNELDGDLVQLLLQPSLQTRLRN
jgi:hypothetical protein